MQVPLEVWNQLLDREDHQTQYQEFMAVLLGYATMQLYEVLLLNFVDNDSVLGSLFKGSSRLPEISLGVGRFWLDMPCRSLSYCSARVESHANLADGPTRDHFEILQRLEAQELEPRLPPWAYQVWELPASEG